MKNWIRKIVERQKGYLFGPGSVPKGVDLFRDIQQYGYAPWVRTVFDVGANAGQFASEVLRNHPQAELFCFEPVRSTFEQLQRNMASRAGVRLFRNAMGALAGGEVAMTSQAGWVMNRVLMAGEFTPPDTPTENVPMETIGNICARFEVAEISLLKTDTEGFDLEVLRGAKDLLAAGKVFLILVEVGFSSADKGHTPFRMVCDFLSDFDIIGFYNQGSDANFSGLDRADVLFIHRGLAGQRIPTRWA